MNGMAMSEARAAGLPQFSLLTRFRFQLLCCVVFGSLIPTCLYLFFMVDLDALFRNERAYQAAQVSLIASMLSAVFGLFFSRKVTAFPGATLLGSALPSFALSFGLLSIAILVARLPYSGAILILNAICSGITIVLLAFITSKGEGPVYHIIPSARVAKLRELPGIRYAEMQKPELPKRRNSFIVADLHEDISPEWERMIALATLDGIPVFHFKQIYESVSGKVQIEHLSENNFGSLLPSMPYTKVKRAGDLILSAIALPLIIIPLLIVALLVKFDSPGPVLFRQKRMGYRGKSFSVIKIRTMRSEDDPELTTADRDAAMTRENDDRITKLGRFLRRTRIDELPQIINIIRGEMSWIGPRPEAVPLSQWYESELPFYSYRHIVRPGITGWAQVNQGHVTELDSINTKLQYDFFYIKYFSYWMDVLITVRTIAVVLSGFGSK